MKKWILLILLLPALAFAATPSPTPPDPAGFGVGAGAATVSLIARADTTPVAVAACGVLSDAGKTYQLSGNISSTGTCITINASNVTLDLHGYTITYGTGDNSNTTPDNYDPVAVGVLISGYNRSNIQIANGAITEGGGTCSNGTGWTYDTERSAYFPTTGNYSGYGCNPIYSNQGATGLDIGGLTITYSADDTQGILVHYDSVNIHENTITDNGTVLRNRYVPKAAIYNIAPAAASTFYKNKIITARHQGIAAGAQATINQNDVSVVSLGTNAAGISAGGAGTKSLIYDNLITARGIHANCIWPGSNVEVYNNYIDMQADAYAIAEGWNGMNGFRRVWDSGDGITIRNNYVVGTTWGSNHATGITLGTDTPTDVINIYENLFFVTSHDGLAKAKGIEIAANPQGCNYDTGACTFAGSEHISIYNNTIKSNLYIGWIGSSYGAAQGYPLFYGNRIIKFGAYAGFKTWWDENDPRTSTAIICGSNTYEGGASANDVTLSAGAAQAVKEILTTSDLCSGEGEPSGSSTGMGMRTVPGGMGMRIP